MTVRRLSQVAAAVALVASGTYVFVYLYRWEWHRAVVAGLFFLVVEVGVVASMVVDRLRGIERRLDAMAQREAAEAVRARLREAAPEPRTNFSWLTRQNDGLSVFVPVLLGAGVVLSAAAWCVERLARATAVPVLERRLSLRLAPLALPDGTLAGRSAPPTLPLRRPFLPLVAVAATVLLAGGGLDALADATQTRIDPDRPGSTSTVVLQVTARRGHPDPVRTAAALWGACTPQLGTGFRTVGMSDVGDGTVEVLVQPAVGKYAERRLRGCLEDATSDRVRGRVEKVADRRPGA